MVTSKDIKKIAEDIKSYVEKNGKIPSKLTIDKTEYNYGTLAYLLSGHIYNGFKDVPFLKVKNSVKASGNSFNEKVEPDDYKSQAKRVYEYCKKESTCPNYVLTVKTKKKARPRMFIYAFARIIVYYYNHSKTLPKYCTYDSSSFKASKTTNTTKKTTKTSTLNSYLTSSGCSGMGQCTGFYCACNSLQQAFYRLTGIKVAESTIAGWAGTTSSGTGHWGIETAVAKFNKVYGKKVKITWYNFNDLGKTDTERWNKFQSFINKGAMFTHIMYRYTYGHYEVPKSVSGSNVIVLNSLGNSCGGGTYCGYIETRSKSTELGYMKGISQKSIAVLVNG